MSYRKIMLPLWGRPKNHGPIDVAFKLAQDFGAHVDVVFVRPDPVSYLAYAGVGYELNGATIQYMVEEARKASDFALAAAKEHLQRLAADMKVADDAAPGSVVKPSYHLRVVQGDFAEAIERESRLCDLVVFGTSEDSGAAFEIREALEGALVGGSRPVLFASPKSGGTMGTNVAIAYDGSAAAAHAVTAALPFLHRAKTVHIFEVLSEKDKGGTLKALRTYLGLRGIECKDHVVEREGKTIGETLAAAAQAQACDMLVMGGYGHSRMREMILGGVTRHVLHKSPNMAILMAH